MKKFALIISAILVAAVTAAALVACTNVPAYKALNSLWDEKEVAVYDVERFAPKKNTDTSTEKTLLATGEMTITTERVNGGTITVGEHTIDNFIGTLITTEMTMTDGSYMNASVAFTAKFVPAAAHKETFVKAYENALPKLDTKETLSAKYAGDNYEYSYSREEGGEAVETKNETIKTGTWSKSPFVDDLMIYHVARASFSGKNGAFQALSVKVPSATENNMKSVSFALASSDIKIKANGVDELAVSKVQVARAPKAPITSTGTPNYVYFNNEPLVLEGEGHAATAGKRVIVKIEEREMEYTLKSFESFPKI